MQASICPPRLAAWQGRRPNRKHRRVRIVLVLLVGMVATVVVPLIGSAPAAASGWRPFVADNFHHRRVAAGFGTARLGGAYAVRHAGAVRLSVRGGQGHVVLRRARASVQTLLRGARARDVSATLAFAVPSVARAHTPVLQSVVARRQRDGGEYSARLSLLPGGRLVIALLRSGRDGRVVLAARRLRWRVSARTTMRLRLRVVGGASVGLRVGLGVGRRPVRWLLSRRDAGAHRIARAGTVGIHSYLGRRGRSASILVRSFRASHLPVRRSTGPAAPRRPEQGPQPGGGSAGSADPVAAPVPSPAPPTVTSPAPVPTTPPSAASPVSVAEQGAAAVGTSAYPIPANALFVSSSSGDDAASGTLTAPLRTVAAAISRARPGTTIVLRGGTYHESVFIPDSKAGLTIQPYPHEAAWFDGSVPITSWRNNGNGTWTSTGWTAQFDHWASFSEGSNAGNFVDPAYPMAPYPDQMFANGAN